MGHLEKTAARRKMLDAAFAIIGLLSTFIGILTLAMLMIDLAK